MYRDCEVGPKQVDDQLEKDRRPFLGIISPQGLYRVFFDATHPKQSIYLVFPIAGFVEVKHFN